MGAASVSRHLSNTFVENWKKAHPGGTVITRDLTTSGLVSITAEWVAAAYTPAESRTAEQKAVLATSDELLAEVEAADELAIGVPMHNFSIPSVLKLWLDQIVRVGQGVCVRRMERRRDCWWERRRRSWWRRAERMGRGRGWSRLNLVEPYLKALFGFIGFQFGGLPHGGRSGGAELWSGSCGVPAAA